MIIACFCCTSPSILWQTTSHCPNFLWSNCTRTFQAKFGLLEYEYSPPQIIMKSIPRLFVNIIAINFSTFCPAPTLVSWGAEHLMRRVRRSSYVVSAPASGHTQARDGFRPAQESKSCLSGYNLGSLAVTYHTCTITWHTCVLSSHHYSPTVACNCIVTRVITVTVSRTPILTPVAAADRVNVTSC